MKKTIMRIIAIAVVIATVFSIGTPLFEKSASAKSTWTLRHDSRIAPGGIAAKNKKLIKKIKANAWSSEANADSDEISVGYACYKIYSTYMKYMNDDYDWEHAFNRVDGYELKDANETQIKKVSANSKAQKNAVKWFSANDIFEYFQWFMTFSKTGTFDAKAKIKRYELVTLFSDVILRFYPITLEDLETNTAWFSSTERSLTQINDNSIRKGIVVGDNLNLDGYATKEDLSRALKNFKLIAKYRIKINFDNNTNIATTEKEMKAKLNEIGAYFEEKGTIVTYKEKSIKLFGGVSSGSEIYMTTDSWLVFLGYDCYDVFDGQSWIIPENEKFNIVEMVKQITEIRYKR